MSISARGALFFGGVLLAACAAPLTWQKPGGSQDEFSSARYECLQQSQQRASAAQVNAYGGAAANQMVTNQALFGACMNSKGWYLHSQNTSPNQTAISPQTGNAFALKQAIDHSRDKWDALCLSTDYSAYFRKSPYDPQNVSLNQLSDAAKITETEKPVVSKIHEITGSETRDLIIAIRRYGGARGAEIAALRERVLKRSTENLLLLYDGKITWGEYNRARKQLHEEFASQARTIMAR